MIPKYQVKISNGHIIKTIPKGIWLNLHNPNLPVLLDKEEYKYEVPCLNVEIERIDTLPLKEDEINNLLSYLNKEIQKIFN